MGLFIIVLPLISFLYASVGHGGASGYLALMALFSFAPEMMRSTALLLNLFVSVIAFYHYYQAGHFNKKLFLYF
ncbi:MAG: sulfite exporter TauE/SafE family protein, partial [Crocinitomicaceae bacterium]